MWTVLLLAGWFGCAGAGRQAAADYVDDLRPLLVENAALADQVLLQAAAIYNEAAGPKDVAADFEARVVPMSEHLAAQASFVTPPPEYAEAHQRLVKIWGDRARAYRGMSEATRTANAELWNAARAKADGVTSQEQTFFIDLNTQLSPMGLQVDPYP